MRSLSTQPRRLPHTIRLALACVVAALPTSALLVACERYADIRDEPDASTIDPVPQLDSGDVPALDSGLGTDAYPSCGDRSGGKCQGPADFPCNFSGWVTSTAASCQTATGCKTNGFLKVTLGADGCVTELGMEQPNDAIVACLLAELGSVRCPCQEAEVTHFFGATNTGPCP
jgi:hypothetical protein